ncbi:D-alanyl-D-alanine carboxypeptidase [Streptomyces sp. SCL15-6]|uniref:D-alanyl-D-alanine carboxypeptidase n=1 Tax=Streptomyces sp. SCL15-6 TaxID=2967222 RepID=UPI0029660F8F|nr:D-alanyl-D-alanine carboxypeptidase [Streptomyces sp. SCL15-6]
MEEASVAGESPDRSKQRESSEEPTSGSAGPVPEARTEASETRDPRLAVAREASAGSAKSGGGVDTATRVLSVRDTETETETPGAAPPGDGGAGNKTAADDEAGTGAEAEADATTGAKPEAGAAVEARTEAGADADAVADAETGAKPETVADAEAGADAVPGAKPEAGADAVPAAKPEAGADAVPAAKPEAVADAEPGAKPEAVAAGEPEAEARSEARPEAATDADADAEPEAGTAPGTEARADAKPVADADADAAPETGAEADAVDGDGPQEAGEKSPSDTSGDGRLRDAVAAWVATADERAAANARHEAADEPEDAASPEEPAQDADAAADGPEDASRQHAGDRADAEPEPDADEKAGAGTGPVDQPTAVFKAVRPPAKPPVDQPTTMLKLGDAGKKGEKADRTDKAGKAETEAERTSKFVALRHPDDPATRKPPRPAQPGSEAPRVAAAGATAAVPQVGPERTTQQPLPPKPPLDLLAELTNTPPPPETPLRTTVRRVKIWTPLVILLVIVFAVVQAMRPLPEPTLDLTAQESFTFEGGKPEIPWPSSGQAALDVQGIGSFGSSGEQKPVPIASVAKVMTAYIILRDHPLKSGADGPKIKIDQAAEDQSQAGQESTVNVTAGDSISQREALESILIASANNVARLLARWDAGSEKAFVEKMNATAEDLGMTNTTYTDPSGLNNTTVSTAVDQVKLAKEAMKQPAFREVAAMMSYDDYKGENHGNWNQLVGHNDVVGIKTGTTTSALGNLVFAAKKEVGGETRTIVGAVVRQPATADQGILAAALSAGDKLIRSAQDTLQSSTILKKGSVVGYVDDGLGNRTPVVATQDVKAVGWAGLTVKLTFEADDVPHTAKAGTKVGTLTVGDGGVSGAVKVPVALQQDLAEPAFTDKLTRIG